MIDLIQQRIVLMRDVFLAVARRDPSVSNEQTIIVAGIVFLIVVLLVLTILILFTPRTRRVVRRRLLVPADFDEGFEAEPDRYGEYPDSAEVAGADDADDRAATQTERGARRVAEALLSVPILVLAGLLVIAGTVYVTETNLFCLSTCHQEYAETPLTDIVVPVTATGMATASPEPRGVAVQQSYHGRCAPCHRADPVSSVMDRARMIWVTVTDSAEASPSAVVDSSACLSCHPRVLRLAIQAEGSRVLMSHQQPHEAGIACVHCHVRAGHTGARSPRMTDCVECHDGVQASADCVTCHPEGRPSDQSTRDKPSNYADRRVYGKVALDSSRCYGCHRTVTCDPCHGLRLPHPGRFLDAGHAYQAAWGKKSLCYRCHEVDACSPCHMSFTPGVSHYVGWEQDHVKVSPEARCTCHDRRNPRRTEPFCTVCHPRR